MHLFNTVAKTFKQFPSVVCFKKNLSAQRSRETLNRLFTILLWAVWSINPTFGWYLPVLEMQNDHILFWFYLFHDHRKWVIVPFLDKRVKISGCRNVEHQEPMKPFIWLWYCHQSCLIRTVHLIFVYIFGEGEGAGTLMKKLLFLNVSSSTLSI